MNHTGPVPYLIEHDVSVLSVSRRTNEPLRSAVARQRRQVSVLSVSRRTNERADTAYASPLVVFQCSL